MPIVLKKKKITNFFVSLTYYGFKLSFLRFQLPLFPSVLFVALFLGSGVKEGEFCTQYAQDRSRQYKKKKVLVRSTLFDFQGTNNPVTYRSHIKFKNIPL